MFGVEVSILEGADRMLLCVSGDLDTSTARELLETITTVVPPFSVAIVDLADVGFMDSDGLAILIQADERLRRRHARMVVANPSDQPSKLIRVSGAAAVLNVTGLPIGTD